MKQWSRKEKKGAMLLGGIVVVVVALILVFPYIGTTTAVVDSPGEMLKMVAPQMEQWVKDKPIAFVEFYSPTCSACQAAKPVLEKLVAEMGLHFAYLDVGYPANKEAVLRHGVEATPTIVVYSYGVPVGEPFVGFGGEEPFRQFLESHVAEMESQSSGL